MVRKANKISKTVISRIKQAILAGDTIVGAAVSSGISRSTFYLWYGYGEKEYFSQVDRGEELPATETSLFCKLYLAVEEAKEQYQSELFKRLEHFSANKNTKEKVEIFADGSEKKTIETSHDVNTTKWLLEKRFGYNSDHSVKKVYNSIIRILDKHLSEDKALQIYEAIAKDPYLSEKFNLEESLKKVSDDY